jgi:hypothetical protein
MAPYQIIERHYPKFRDAMTAQDKPLTLHVQQEFSEHLMGRVLGIVYRAISVI